MHDAKRGVPPTAGSQNSPGAPPDGDTPQETPRRGRRRLVTSAPAIDWQRAVAATGTRSRSALGRPKAGV